MLQCSTRHAWTVAQKTLRQQLGLIQPDSFLLRRRRPQHSFSTSNQETPHTRHQTVFSGIQPTGVPHLGNYLGALRQWVHIQDTSPPDATLLFSVVDLHALTLRQEPNLRLRCRRQVLAVLLAIGLCPDRCTLFYQSAVPQHTELHWILSCDASMGWLSRMRQWQSKVSDEDVMQEITQMLRPSPNPRSVERTKLGLFAYPVLQAADILVHRATHVPVGEDQVQHLEFARNCANVFNHTYRSDALIPPETVVGKARRVMSLVEPEKKMSKSDVTPRSMVLLNDSHEKIRNKFRAALTDSMSGVTYDREKRPGVSNLIEILSYFDKDGRSCQSIAEDCKDMHLRVLKEKVADTVNEHISPIREKYESLIGTSSGRTLDEIAAHGADRASRSAEKTMKLVREAVGL